VLAQDWKKTEMQLSLRSQMIAGVAAFGAAAVALTPIAQMAPIAQSAVVPSLAHVSSAVQLSSLVNPIAAIAGVIEGTVSDVFNSSALPDQNSLYWPDSFYNDANFDYPYAPGFVGAIPDLVNQFSFGTLSALVNNASGYVEGGLATLALGEGVTTAIWNTPQAVVAAVGYLAAGDTAAALAVLQDQIIAPLTTSFQEAASGIGYIVDNVLGNIGVLTGDTLPRLVANLSSQVIGSATYIVNSAIATVTQVATDLAGLQFEAAWNDAINGFLGANGTLGQIAALTVGATGIVQDITYDDGQGGTITVPTVVVPSLRAVATSTFQRLGDYRSLGYGGILNEPFAPLPVTAAAVPAKRAAAAAAVTAKVAAVATGVSAASNEAPAAAAPVAAAPKSVGKHVGRAAAAAKAAGAAAATGRAAAAK